jgi:hypothetical protein
MLAASRLSLARTGMIGEAAKCGPDLRWLDLGLDENSLQEVAHRRSCETRLPGDLGDAMSLRRVAHLVVERIRGTVG